VPTAIRNEFGQLGQQTQDEKQTYLHNFSKAVKEKHYVTFAFKLHIAKINTQNIESQIPITAQKIRCGICNSIIEAIKTA